MCRINNEYLGITVESYINQLLNRKIVGLTSGVSATIVKILSSSESERDNLTIYVKYDSSGVANDNSKFIDAVFKFSMEPTKKNIIFDECEMKNIVFTDCDLYNVILNVSII